MQNTYKNTYKNTAHCADNLQVLRQLPDNSVDSIVTDAPYGLGKEPNPHEMLTAWLQGETKEVSGGGFMGKKWDSFVPQPELWREAYRVLKPGGHVLSFFGTRTYDWGVMAMRLAGFEIRDRLQWLFDQDTEERQAFVESLNTIQQRQLGNLLKNGANEAFWMFGSGFPKSLNIGKAIDKMKGVERKVIGRSTNGSGAQPNKLNNHSKGDTGIGYADGSGKTFNITAPATPEAQKWEGWGSQLKPSNEPIVLARKPLEEKTIAANVLKWGTGGINVDACRVGIENVEKGRGGRNCRDTGIYGKYEGQENKAFSQGRFPANLLHDGSKAVLDLFPETAKSKANKQSDNRKHAHNKIYGNGKGWGRRDPNNSHSDNGGSAARFFYCAKTSKKERGKDNRHPTVKPLKLMQYLVRLVTPPEGLVLDMYAGSGTTGLACQNEGFDYLLIEQDAAYFEILQRRLKDNEKRLKEQLF